MGRTRYAKVVEEGRSRDLEILSGLRMKVEEEVGEDGRRRRTGVEGRTTVDLAGLGRDASTVHWELYRDHAIVSQLSLTGLGPLP